MSAPQRGGRASWHVRANAVVITYVALAAATLPLSRVLPADVVPTPRWLAIHLLMLGAVTNAIIIWGEHFAIVLMRAPARSRRRSAVLLAALNAAVVAVLVGVVQGFSTLTALGAAGMGLVVAAHIHGLLHLMRGALQGRFAGTVRYYVGAGLALLVGGSLGTLLALGDAGSQRHLVLRAAHVHANLLGWVGLTVLGTLFTLWPTVLRTRMSVDAMWTARWCLPLLGVGLIVGVTFLALDRPVAAAGGLGVYAFGVGMALWPFLDVCRRRPPSDAPSWFLATATAWLLVGVLTDLTLMVTARDTGAYVGRLTELVPLFIVGFVGQVLVGALTYLLPVVVGGGPLVARAAAERLGWAWPARLGVVQVALVVLALPAPGWADRAAWLSVFAAAAGFVMLAGSLLVGGAGLLGRNRPA